MWVLFINPLQAKFSPERRKLPRTHEATLAVFAHTNAPVEDDARLLHSHHLPSSFVDDFGDGTVYSGETSTVANHFLIEGQPSVLLVVLAYRRRDLPFWFDSDAFARFQIDLSGRRRLPRGNGTLNIGNLSANQPTVRCLTYALDQPISQRCTPKPI